MLITPNPATLKPRTAEKALADFLLAWHGQDWRAMSDAAQITWESEDRNPAEFMALNFDFRELQSAEMVRVGKWEPGPTTLPTEGMVITTKIQLKDLAPMPKTVTAEIIVVCETAPYTSSPNGMWGVNPLSLIKSL